MTFNAVQPSLFDAPRLLKTAVGKRSSYSSLVIANNEQEPRFEPSQTQMKAVYDVMKRGRWMTLAEIAFATTSPEASVSARLRDLRKRGFDVTKRKAKEGKLFQYRLTRA